MNAIFNLTFFSVGSLIVFLIGVLFFSFIFFIKEKNKITLQVAISLLILSLVQLLHFISSITYDPLSAFHRIGTIFFSLAGSIHIYYIFILYQGNYYPGIKKIGKIFFYIFYSVLISVVFICFIRVLSANKLYNFSGHYWDFDTDLVNQQIDILILFYRSIYISVGAWSIYRVYKYIKKIEYSYVMILLLFILITIPTDILNVLSRDALILRETYQMITVCTAIIGMFSITILYLNISNEKTKITHKIIAVTFSIFLLLMQLLSQKTSLSNDISYDNLKSHKMQLYIASQKLKNIKYLGDLQHKLQKIKSLKKWKDLKYLGYFDFKNNQYSLMFSLISNPPSLSTRRTIDWKNSKIRFLLNNLSTTNNQEFYTEFSRSINQAHPEFLAYKNMLLSILNENKEITSTKEIFDALDTHKLRIGYIRKKLKKIPEADFHKKASSFLEVNNKRLTPFVETIKALITNQKHKKSEILLYLRPFLSPEKRKYRSKIQYEKEKKFPERFISFNHMDVDSNRLYEAGFSYLSYRQKIHSVSSDFFITIILFSGFILLTFGLFFSHVLIKPLQKVIQGFREINTGNLNYRVNVYAEDEIGFLASSFNQMGESLEAAHKQLQEYAEGLEKKVQERTAELNNTLTKVTNLKNQQDGDYLLTYLLTHPLSANQVSSKRFEIDFLLRQRKKFSFKKYINKDLGGDINITNQIELYQTKYITFLNADGMGKSMQGAVGALICGSVFSSIVDRTQKMTIFKNQYPEKWLKSTFIELHHIFKSFSGNMLVSCIIGLIEENTGMMYYINAEHPRIALYRTGTARFINEQKGILGKLGTLDIEEDVHIRTFRMKTNDIILFGSDGKDELVLGKSEDGSRLINEDQGLFLKVIEKSEGNLKKMFKVICHYGRIIDDISLIKIQYIGRDDFLDPAFTQGTEQRELLINAEACLKKGDTQKAEKLLNKIQETKQNNQAPSKKLMALMTNLKKYEMAFQEAERCLTYQPDDIQILYSMTYIAKKLNNITQAIDLAERFHLRDINNTNNLIQLAELHVIQKNYKRVGLILEMLENLEPHHPKVKKIKSLLKSGDMLT